jgi:hypothetical protein
MKIDLTESESLIEEPKEIKVSVEKSALPKKLRKKRTTKKASAQAPLLKDSNKLPLPGITPPPSKQHRPSFPLAAYRRMALGFAVGAVVLLGVVLYFAVSEAQVKLSARRERTSTTFVATIREIPEAGTPSANGLIFPGHIIKKTAEISRIFESSKSRTSDEKASGKVTIINNFSKPQPLVKTTRLLSKEGVLFRLKESVTVPAKGKVEASVEADQPGKVGEIGPTRFTVPGLWVGLQDLIYAESSVPMSGGVREVRIVTKDDLESAKTILEDELTKEAIGEVEKAGEAKPALTFTEITKSVSSEKEGVEKDSFEYSLRLDGYGIFFDKSKLLEEATKQLKAGLTSPDRIIANIEEKTFTYFLDEYRANKGEATVKVYLEGESAISPSSPVLAKEKIAGLSRKSAEDYFKSLPELSKADVKIYPFWVGNIPSNLEQITIEVK